MGSDAVPSAARSLRACPFCGSSGSALQIILAINKGRFITYVACGGCYAQGPGVSDGAHDHGFDDAIAHYKAAQAWNDRST